MVRDTARRPRLEGGDERVLDGLFGEVEVAEDADERRDRPSLLVAEQAVDDLAGDELLVQPATASVRRVPVFVGSAQSTTGRTSIEPCWAPGIIAA